MPNNEAKLSALEQAVEDAKDRREALELAVEDVPQANIDLMCFVIAGDPEKRSASYWIAEAFVYVHKYQDRLRKYAAERKEAKDRKENENLFSKYVAMSQPRSANELLTLMQRFGVCPQIPIPAEVPVPNAPEVPKAS
jgi:hypothetical protein